MKKSEQVPDDLVAAVDQMLIDAGHSRPTDWHANLHQDAYNNPDKNIQRFLINRALRTVLGNVETESTLEERTYLEDKAELHDWLRLVNQGVIPCMVNLNLPPAIN